MNSEIIFKQLMHPSGIESIPVVLEIFHLDISGNDISDTHSLNINFILKILVVFH